jgi:cation diffusion facilitator CzcD-associated flavoprotein CzcO
MAFLPFPKSWPKFTPKDKLADWFEAYASIMELNVWMKTIIESADYDETSSTWTVVLTRADGSSRTLRPRHIVWATGHAGEAVMPRFPGQENFRGQLYHSIQHVDASTTDVAGKQVVVVGTGNSGHDIAQNFYESDAKVTMLQRRGTYVISVSKGIPLLHGDNYEGDSPTDEADIYWQSLPFPVAFVLNGGLTSRISEVDKDVLDGLARAGFDLDYCHDNSGILRKYLTRGGGYYIDVGCSQLIVDGKIKVKQSRGIAKFDPDGLVLADGSKLQADVVVLATGYDNMRTTVRKALGDKVADRCKDVWDLDGEGELNAVRLICPACARI